jgi:hypothetical protein
MSATRIFLLDSVCNRHAKGNYETFIPVTDAAVMEVTADLPTGRLFNVEGSPCRLRRPRELQSLALVIASVPSADFTYSGAVSYKVE